MQAMKAGQKQQKKEVLIKEQKEAKSKQQHKRRIL